MGMRGWIKRIGKVLGALVVLFGLIQLIPYGRTHSNPAVLEEPEWDSPRTRELAEKLPSHYDYLVNLHGGPPKPFEI